VKKYCRIGEKDFSSYVPHLTDKPEYLYYFNGGFGGSFEPALPFSF